MMKKDHSELSAPDSGQDGSSCDIPHKGDEGFSSCGGTGAMLKYRGGGDWDGVEPVPYKDGGDHWDGVVRRLLVGRPGDGTAFHLRYFEIGKNGYSSLEYHQHVHVVIGVRGLGEVRIGDRTHRVGPFDVAVIGSAETHQLLNRNEEPFGFFCIVDAERDRPVLLEEET